MERKEVVFDGGPLDGRTDFLFADQSSYQYSIVEKEDSLKAPVINHFYDEDPNVPGHFIYRGTTEV